jgi:predicted nucleic acid-binding protein
METEVILDTDVIIDHLRKKPDPTATKLFHMINEGRLTARTTSMSAFELYRGARLAPEPEKRMLEAKGIFRTVDCLPFDEAAANTASEISITLERKGESVEIRDLFIGAVARTSRLPLVTKNTEHFGRIPELTVITPSDLLEKIE